MNSRVLCVVIVFISALAAQTWRGVISGTLTGSAGAAVPGTAITITEAATGKSRTAATNAEGAFTFASLAPGEYMVAVDRSGLAPIEQKVTLLVNQDVRLDL